MRIFDEPQSTVSATALQSGLPTNGALVLDRIIHELGVRAARGENVAIVWDIDGTIADTRPRMLAALHAYGRTELRLSDLRDTAPHTTTVIQEFGLDARRFTSIWNRVFWDGQRFKDDLPIPEVADRMRLAAKLGIKNVVLTGRNTELAGESAAFLRMHAIPFTMLLCKRYSEKTVPVKVAKLDALQASGLHVGGFVTDAAQEVAGLERGLPGRSPTCIVVAAQGRPIHGAEGLRAHVLPVTLR